MVAISGANGLLGSYVARQLLRENQPFVALKREGSDISILDDVNDKITWRNTDVLNPVALHEALHDVTGVIHTAAIVSFNPRDKEKLLTTNTEGTKNVVDACLQLGIRRLLHVSSVAALGRLKKQEVITEENRWTDSSMNSAYAESKYRAELEVFRGQEEGLRTIIVNPSVILSRSDWNRSSSQLFKYVWKQNPFYIDGSLNYIDVRDLAEIMVKLYASDYEGERFIVNAGAISFADFFNALATRLNRRPPYIKLSKSILPWLAQAEQVRSALTGANPVITRETARLAGTHFVYSNGKITSALNTSFQPIEESLDWCCTWYKELAIKK
ncbi:NAD-dependent epimerase/dehydratase family protein [Oscillatoria amoena NRMC-F 0135]|nr:NAD-dependent epimerase/dehydratase family protein [Oscillatoria amoena NRMC-F 0135]